MNRYTSLMDFIFRHINSNTQVSAGELNSLPFPKRDAIREGKIVCYVNGILGAKKKNPEANTMDFEHAIDEIVYELYGLTKDEIKIVEEAR